MKTKNLKENFGTQAPSFAGGGGSNFSIGADLGTHSKGRLGTRGADSKFSQRMQAIVPNDYYDLLEEEDEEEIDESYFVENSRYSLKDLNLFEAGPRRVTPTPNMQLFWTNKIKKSIDTIGNSAIKKKIDNFFEDAKDNFSSGSNPISYWTTFIAQLNFRFLKSYPVLQSLFNKTLGLDSDLMRNIIFAYSKLLGENETVVVGQDSNFPTVKFNLLRDPSDDQIINFLKDYEKDKEKFERSLRDKLENHFNKDAYNHYKKIFLILPRSKAAPKNLYEKAVEDNYKNIIHKIQIYENTKKAKTRPPSPAQPSPSAPSVDTSRVSPPEPEPVVTPEPDLDLSMDSDDDASDTSDDVSDSEDSSEVPVPPRSGTPPSPSSSAGASSPARSSRKPPEANPFDELIEDPIFDNPFVKLFVKRSRDPRVDLTDFYNYFKNKKRKTNESFDLALNQKSLSYLIEEGVLDDLVDIGTDVVGDLGAAAASAGTFGVTSAAFILKNLYELKETSKKADIAIEAFLLNPSDEACENIEKILSDIITDFIDLIQRTVEAIPGDVVGELVSSSSSILANTGKVLSSLKTFFSASDTLSKIKNLGKMHLILKPFIKIILSILDSEQTPEEIKNDKRFVLGTLNKMILIIDLTEDYYIQKRVAETAGIKDFEYKNKIFQKNRSFDDYDPQTSYARKSPEQREREYSSENDVDSDFDFDFLQDSLKRKSLTYLISESEEDVVDEEVEAEGQELEEFSGAGAVAGFTLPLGASPRGPKGEHSSTSGGKAYPYTSSNRSKFNKFSKKTFGGK